MVDPPLGVMTHVPHEALRQPNINEMAGSLSTTAGRRVPAGTSLVILSLRNVILGMGRGRMPCFKNVVEENF